MTRDAYSIHASALGDLLLLGERDPDGGHLTGCYLPDHRRGRPSIRLGARRRVLRGDRAALDARLAGDADAPRSPSPSAVDASSVGLGGAARDPPRRDALLRRAGRAGRPPRGGARRRRRDRPQPDLDRRALPSGRRGRRLTDRLRRRRRAKAGLLASRAPPSGREGQQLAGRPARAGSSERSHGARGTGRGRGRSCVGKAISIASGRLVSRVLVAHERELEARGPRGVAPGSRPARRPRLHQMSRLR